MTSKISWNSEVFASELLENLWISDSSVLHAQWYILHVQIFYHTPVYMIHFWIIYREEELNPRSCKTPTSRPTARTTVPNCRLNSILYNIKNSSIFFLVYYNIILTATHVQQCNQMYRTVIGKKWQRYIRLNLWGIHKL